MFLFHINMREIKVSEALCRGSPLLLRQESPQLKKYIVGFSIPDAIDALLA
jgi:hypothetical protein